MLSTFEQQVSRCVHITRITIKTLELIWLHLGNSLVQFVYIRRINIVASGIQVISHE